MSEYESQEPYEHEDLIMRLVQDQLLRREAGEGWHPQGLNEYLLKRIVEREEILETMTDLNIKPPRAVVDPGDIPQHDSILFTAYRAVALDIDSLKSEADIGTPPPLPLEDD
jgi:hypothetical protein